MSEALDHLHGWQGGWLPAKVRPLLPMALAQAESALRPASPMQFAQAMKLVTDWCVVHGIKAEGDKLATVWKSLLGDLPADLLLSATRAVLAGQTMHVVPKPGQVRDAAEGEMVQRRAQRMLVSRAEFKSRVEPDDAPRGESTPEGRERVKAMFATLKRSLAAPPADQMDADQLAASRLPPAERAAFWAKRMKGEAA